jgi:Phosphotransferase enzyme family.
VIVGHGGAALELAIKIPHTSQGAASLERQRATEAQIHQDGRLTDWSVLVPRPVGAGRTWGRRYFVETIVPGHPALSGIVDPAKRVRIESAAASTIAQLHLRTAESVQVDDSIFNHWVDQPLATLGGIRLPTPSDLGVGPAIASIRQRLHGALSGRRLQASWIHGDYWRGNLLLAADGVTPSGIIDWDRSAQKELPWHDLFHLLLYTRRYVDIDDASDVIALLRGEAFWDAEEEAILSRARGMIPDAEVSDDIMVLLYWLRLTAATLTLYPKFSRDRAYLSAYVEPVLKEVTRS